MVKHRQFEIGDAVRDRQGRTGTVVDVCREDRQLYPVWVRVDNQEVGYASSSLTRTSHARGRGNTSRS